MNTLIQELEARSKCLTAVVDRLKADILALPDNPRIKRVSEAPNCFTMSSKCFGKGLSMAPGYHDFKCQYRLLVDSISNIPPTRVVAHLKKVLDQGYIQDKFPCNRQNLHPDVIQHMSKLIGYTPKG